MTRHFSSILYPLIVTLIGPLLCNFKNLKLYIKMRFNSQVPKKNFHVTSQFLHEVLRKWKMFISKINILVPFRLHHPQVIYVFRTKRNKYYEKYLLRALRKEWENEKKMFNASNHFSFSVEKKEKYKARKNCFI